MAHDIDNAGAGSGGRTGAVSGSSQANAGREPGAGHGTWRLIVAVAIILAILAPVALLVHAHSTNGRDGFPLDDPWIHLTYARTLHQHHQFAYQPDAPAAQGSTSPLYTMLLALGFSVTQNEKLLSYALGILFQLLFLGALAVWAQRRLGGWSWAAAAVLLVGLDSRVAILAVSGMETSLFLLCIAAVFAFLASGRRMWAGLFLGLSVWVRPDGLILLALAALDGIAERVRTAGGSWRSLLRFLAPALALTAAYGAFNLAVGGRLLPNTFAAKTAFYAVNSRADFLTGDLKAAFLSHGWILLTPLAAAGVLREAYRFLSGRPERFRLEARWAVALPLAYLILLPFSHRFERYLIPALPAVAVLGLGLVQELGSRLAGRRPKRGPNAPPDRLDRSGPGRPADRRDARGSGPAAAKRQGAAAGLAAAGLASGALVLQIFGLIGSASLYAAACDYHWVRHERTALWLKEDTPFGSVVATHEVGALGFYSERTIVDMVGVITPEAVGHLNSPDYLDYVEDLLMRTGATHLAVLRNWFEVVNVDPLFTADPKPEIMEVFPWIPGQTHLMPRTASLLNRDAAAALRAGDRRGALDRARTSLSLDPGSSRTWLLYGGIMEEAGRPGDAALAYRAALDLFPGLHMARYRRIAALLVVGDTIAARAELDTLETQSPEHPGLRNLLERIP